VNGAGRSAIMRARRGRGHPDFIEQFSPAYGPLAQLVEQLAFNQLVARSNRAGPTIESTSCAEPAFHVGGRMNNAREW
jgi:hypothetical protein